MTLIRLRVPLSHRWQGITAHYAYFRCAEYPMGRLDALYHAYRMGWRFS